MTTANLVLLPGDGIGPEIVAEAQKVLERVAKRFGHTFTFSTHLIGGAAIDATGGSLPRTTVEACQACDAVLLGAVGGPKWDDPRAKVRPEQGLLAIRQTLGLYANLRPVRVHPALMAASPIKEDRIAGVDILFVRELTGGLYFGEPRLREKVGDHTRAVDTLVYTDVEIRRVIRMALKLAAGRRKLLTSVDKANVLDTSILWREVVSAMAKDYPDVALSHMYVDNAAMQLLKNPKQFDVIVTGNMFGDILSDEASMLAGSIGMLPSASLDANQKGLYEPIHGSAPDIAGQDKANPLATILSLGMMFRYTFALPDVAQRIEGAVRRVLQQGLRTGDIALPGEPVIGTKAMGAAVVAALRSA
jgi:3-isopropylmalate dehydrogenase